MFSIFMFFLPSPIKVQEVVHVTLARSIHTTAQPRLYGIYTDLSHDKLLGPKPDNKQVCFSYLQTSSGTFDWTPKGYRESELNI